MTETDKIKSIIQAFQNVPCKDCEEGNCNKHVVANQIKQSAVFVGMKEALNQFKQLLKPKKF